MWVLSLGWEDLLEEGMATHSSILAWRDPMDREAWWATVHVVAKSWTQLKRLSMTLNEAKCLLKSMPLHGAHCYPCRPLDSDWVFMELKALILYQ